MSNITVISLGKQCAFNEIMMSVLYYASILSWNFSLHYITEAKCQRYICRSTLTRYPDFESISCLLFLLNAACLTEKQQIPILQSLVWPNMGLEHTIDPQRRRVHWQLHHICGYCCKWHIYMSMCVLITNHYIIKAT